MLDLLHFIPPNDHASVFSGAGVYADDALDDAIAYGLALGAVPTIQFPAGRLKFARTVHLKKTVKLVGHGSGLAGAATICQFDANQSGFVVHRHNTGPDGIEESGTAADASVLDGLRVEGSGTTGHAIRLRGRATIRDCQIHRFGENGVHIVADVRSSESEVHGNANAFLLDTVQITNCGGHGVYCDGGDANAGECRHIDVTSNGGWGIWDSSFLGNTWIACHASNNGLGAYKCDGRNARSVFLGCYSEGDQPPSEFSPTTLILGGLHGAGLVGGQWMRDGRMSPFSVMRGYGDRAVEYRYGNYAGFDMLVDGDHTVGWQFGWWDEDSGTVQIRHARLNSRVPLRFTTELTTTIDAETGAPIPPGQAIMHRVWAHDTNGRHRKIDFLDLLKRIEALEQA